MTSTPSSESLTASRPNVTIGASDSNSNRISKLRRSLLFGLAFFSDADIELNFDTDCFIAYVTSCSYTN